MKFNRLAPFVQSVLLTGAALSYTSASAEVVDILVLYTPEALETRNGSDIEARIAAYIDYTNTAYSNSEVDLQLRLVGSELVDLPYTRVTEINLRNLSQNSEVASLRESTGADIVTLLNLRQEMSGGYVCGIGYVPQGDSNNGNFYSYAPQAAFNLVGIDCDVNTFAHEVGHNMSLGHSYAQNSAGGIWEWSRGHGVSGLFSTVMAYPHSFGTRNQLPVFSNPNVINCGGLACGVERSQHDGADSSWSLNALASQIAEFKPTRIPNTQVPSDDDDTPSTEHCQHNEIAENMLRNGQFDDLEGWSSGFGYSSLDIQAMTLNGCVENVLEVSDRQAYYSSAIQYLDEPMKAGINYKFSGMFSISHGDRAAIRVAVRVRTSRSRYYIYLDPLSVTPNEFTNYSQSFTLNSGEADAILIYGPPAGVDMIMDSISVVPINQ